MKHITSQGQLVDISTTTLMVNTAMSRCFVVSVNGQTAVVINENDELVYTHDRLITRFDRVTRGLIQSSLKRFLFNSKIRQVVSRVISSIEPSQCHLTHQPSRS